MPTTRPVHKPTIIYVEDNAGDALLLREALHERLHDVHLVVIEQGDQALHYFQVKARIRDIPPPHCILLDSHLPIITGVELVEFIRGAEGYNDTPVYIFASESDYGKLRKAITISNESFLIKPIAWEGFLALADLLMKSAKAKDENTVADAGDAKPEVHAEGALRLHAAAAATDAATVTITVTTAGASRDA
jgi:CheY-like chemotaxis protein